MKVFSVHKWKESMGFDRKGAEDDLANGWPQEWDGKTEKQITKLGYNTIYEWNGWWIKRIGENMKDLF